MRDLDAPPPTLEERARYRVAWYKTPAIWRASDWRCRCDAPHSKRHAQPWLCIGDLELAVWRVAHPGVTTSDRSARCLMWMDREFGR